MVSLCKYLPFSSVAVIDERYTYAYRARDHYKVWNIMPVGTKIQFPAQNCSYKYIYYLTTLVVQKETFTRQSHYNNSTQRRSTIQFSLLKNYKYKTRDDENIYVSCTIYRWNDQ
jgi:hypothetical protein